MIKEVQRHSAETLKHYMDFRALEENSKNKLDGDFFYDGFEKGVFTFFGIECNPNNGNIIKDTQNPKAYKEYLEIIEKETSK